MFRIYIQKHLELITTCHDVIAEYLVIISKVSRSFPSNSQKYFFGSKGALAICDASNSASFKNLPSWIESFRNEVGDKPIIFLANKCDLKDQKVTEDDMTNE